MIKQHQEPRPRHARRGRLFTLLLAFSLSLEAVAPGQLPSGAGGVPNANTVRENEFRSRWADYQVDRPPPPGIKQPADSSDEQGGLLSAFGRTFNDHFRNGPFQLRADFSAGYEFTNESILRVQDPSGSEFSPFIAPALAMFYNVESGPLTLSARYSAGYVYYLDQSYLAVAHNGGIFSQTAGLDLALEGSRTKWHSATSASDGTGSDIQSGTLRNRIAVGESLDGIYTVTDLTQVGITASLSYSVYSGVPSVADTNQSGTAFGDYIITGKTRLRLEFGVGDDRQNAGNTNTDSSYYQAVLKVNYLPSPKLTLDGGLGWAVRSSTAALNGGGSNSHPVYTITVNYAATDKTSAAFHLGYEGIDIDPDLSLQAKWQPRETITLGLSVYQNSNFSTFEASQNLVTRGGLASLGQRLFGKVDVNYATGAEQSKNYTTGNSNQQPSFGDPYFFGSVSFLWQLNSALALQGYYRGYTGQAGNTVTSKGLQSRASISLRLTF